jgi:hypothetical protein
MLRSVIVMFSLVALGAAAHADTYKCRNTFTNNIGEGVSVTAKVTTNGTVTINGASQDNQGTNTYPVDLVNDKSEVEADHEGGSGCNLEVTVEVLTGNVQSDKLNMKSVRSKNSSTEACTAGDTTKGFYVKYECDCQKSKGEHHAEIDMTCGKS